MVFHIFKGIGPFHNVIFPRRGAARTPYISLWVITTNCRLYSNISQILLLYKTWRHYNKFYSMKSLEVYYWCFKIPQCRYMEHGLKHITSHVQKHIAPLAMCYNPPLVRDEPLGTPFLWNSSIVLTELENSNSHIFRCAAQCSNLQLDKVMMILFGCCYFYSTLRWPLRLALFPGENYDAFILHGQPITADHQDLYSPRKHSLIGMMTSPNGNIFRVTGHLCGEFTGHRWIPHTKVSDAELWCFLWSVPEQAVE